MRSRLVRLNLLPACLLSLAGCLAVVAETDTPTDLCPAELPTARVTLVSGDTEVRFSVEVAESRADRARGLSGRASLGEGCGMLFRYAELVRNPFWMRGMAFPLDIAFANAQGRIVEVTTLQPCDVDPCPRHVPTVPYRFALEVGAGTLEDIGVEVGDRLVVEP